MVVDISRIERAARLDRVLRYMVPQGFSPAEVGDAANVAPRDVRRRAKEIGLPFEDAFGPESKCVNGHRLEEVGYSMLRPKNRRPTRRCKECHRQSAKRSNMKRNAKRREARALKREERRRLQPKEEEVRDDYYTARMATNAILALHQAKDRCSTWWEREKVQAQINALTIRVAQSG